MFKPEFAAKVLSGEKYQTIRPVPKRRPEIGNAISLRTWKGAPYRSKQRILREGTVTGVDPIRIGHNGITVGTIALNPDEEWELAKADGFNTPKDMLDWFAFEHGLPFSGIIIRWK